MRSRSLTPRTAVPRLKLPIRSVRLISSAVSAALPTVLRWVEYAATSVEVGVILSIRVENLSVIGIPLLGAQRVDSFLQCLESRQNLIEG